MEIKINLKNIIGELLTLAKPGTECDAPISDASTLENFENFCKVCNKNGEHDNKDMSAVAALLLEMQIKGNVPEEYTELSEVFSEMVKKNKKLDVSESRDYVLNTNTGKFHYPSCKEAAKIKDKNRENFFGTRESVIDMGYDPCGRCHP